MLWKQIQLYCVLSDNGSSTTIDCNNRKKLTCFAVVWTCFLRVVKWMHLSFPVQPMLPETHCNSSKLTNMQANVTVCPQPLIRGYQQKQMWLHIYLFKLFLFRNHPSTVIYRAMKKNMHYKTSIFIYKEGTIIHSSRQSHIWYNLICTTLYETQLEQVISPQLSSGVLNRESTNVHLKSTTLQSHHEPPDSRTVTLTAQNID